MRWFCRHRFWQPIDPLYTPVPTDSLSISWGAMMCERCGKVRDSNLLRPGESVVLPVVLDDDHE